MFRKLLLLTFLIHTFTGHGQNSKYPQDYFESPLDIPLYLSGTFGELRSNHFHSGIDIKTNGREGQSVKAIAEGVVYRIKISPYGFGNALYVRHPNGYSSVYGHLKEFNAEIKEYVRKQQYLKKSFSIELYPSAELFPVEKGEVIALSGNSGGSGGPHLHFEIRDSRTEKIINPLLFGFDVKDSRKPDINGLTLYDFVEGEMISSQNLRLIESKDGECFPAGNGIVEVSGNPAFGINTYDRLDSVANKNGVFEIKMWIDEVEFYDYKMETFAFDETRYINSHIDYAQKICCGKVINRLYLEPNNKLSVYGQREKMRLPELQVDSLYDVRIEVKDLAGNSSSLNFRVKKTSNAPADSKNEIDLPVFKYAQTNFFKNDKVDIVLPEGALYRDVYFEFRENKPCADCLSPIYTLGAREIPIQKYYNVKIKPSIVYKGDPSKLAIASFKNGRLMDYEGGKWENGYVVGRTRQLGDFAIIPDTTPPLVVPVNFAAGRNVSAHTALKIRIADNFSGIDTYYPEIDGNWVLMRYDAKSNMLILEKEDMDVQPGAHVLTITVKDVLGNKTFKSYSLIF